MKTEVKIEDSKIILSSLLLFETRPHFGGRLALDSCPSSCLSFLLFPFHAFFPQLCLVPPLKRPGSALDTLRRPH